MNEHHQIDSRLLSRLIGSLPPGRARRKYEDLLTQIKDRQPLGGVLCKTMTNDAFDEVGQNPRPPQTPRFTLKVETNRDMPGPIYLASGITIIDPGRFIAATLADLAAYVVAKNRGSRHWVENLLVEKVEHLRL